METYAVELTGIAPVKFNHPTPDSIQGLEPGSKSKKREDAAGREAEALTRLLRNDAGEIIASARQIKRAILDGASMGSIKIGRKGALVFIKAVVIVSDGTFGVKDPDRIIEDVVRIPPRTGALVLKAWPQLDPGWTLRFDLTLLEPSILGPGVARAALDSAGILAGLGTERPAFGRFTVSGWHAT
jgi:hypothetical protein